MLIQNTNNYVIIGYHGNDRQWFLGPFSASGGYILKTNWMTPIFFLVITFGIWKRNCIIILKKFYEADFLQMQKRAICK